MCVDIKQADLNAIDLDTENKKFLSVVIMDIWLRKLKLIYILFLLVNLWVKMQKKSIPECCFCFMTFSDLH